MQHRASLSVTKRRFSKESTPVPTFRGLAPASDAASRSKRSNRKTDSFHEILLRRELTKLRVRYRKYARDIPGNPDLVFRAAKVVVFCDGDFWHGRNWTRLKKKLRARHNADYWIAKISRNRSRDKEVHRKLTRAGWHVVRLWETDILRDPLKAACFVKRAVTSKLAMQSRLSSIAVRHCRAK
jgi:DNA mismatch endonuclease (patch repair protein)